MAKHSLDQIDREILTIVQQDATITVSDIAAQVGLSSTPCWRRIQRLESAGYIRKRVTLLDREKLNLSVSVFVSVRTRRHATDWLDTFKHAVQSIPEIVEAHRLSGEVDYLLRVVVPDITGYDRVYRRLINMIEFADVSSSFSMEELKFTTALPVDYA